MSSRGDPSDPVESLDAERALEALAARYDRVRPSRWAPVPEALDQAIAADVALGEAARRARRHLPEEVESRLCPFLPAASVRPYEGALLTVPRERFVLPEDLALSAIDTPLSLDQKGNATISAPHAYLLTFALLDLREGDHLLELGTGTGYGAALALAFLGPRGHVTSIEIDPVLAERARRILASPDLGGGDRLTLVEGDALAFADRLPELVQAHPAPLKIAFTFGLLSTPERFLDLLPEGAVLVAPVSRPSFWGDESQELERWERRHGELIESSHGPVRYVTERH